MDPTIVAFAVVQIGAAFSLAPFDVLLQPLIEETLAELGKDHWRRGTRLIPALLVWLVLVLTLRRDLNYDQALNWMMSGFRWLADILPARAKLVSDGAISHARVKLGVEVFRVLWNKLVASFRPLPADFHGLISAIFDGSTGTMPDTEANRTAFGKPKARTGTAAFPQVRLMGLLAVARRQLLDVAFAPYTGKSTGERALMRTILARQVCRGLLFLMDAGLYAFDVLWDITQKGGHVIVKVPAHIKFKRTQRLPDGSWLAELTNKVLDPTRPPTPQGRRHWSGLSHKNPTRRSMASNSSGQSTKVSMAAWKFWMPALRNKSIARVRNLAMMCAWFPFLALTWSSPNVTSRIQLSDSTPQCLRMACARSFCSACCCSSTFWLVR
jgi:hypothetical protein